MATPKLTDIREFHDRDGVRWRVFITQKVQRWSADAGAWVDSDKFVDELESHPDITEIGGS